MMRKTDNNKKRITKHRWLHSSLLHIKSLHHELSLDKISKKSWIFKGKQPSI